MKIAFLKHLNAGLVTPAAEAASRKAGVTITNTGRDVVLTIQDFNGGSRLTATLPATGLTTAKAVRPLLRRLAARQAAYTAALTVAWAAHAAWVSTLNGGVGCPEAARAADAARAVVRGIQNDPRR